MKREVVIAIAIVIIGLIVILGPTIWVWFKLAREYNW